MLKARQKARYRSSWFFLLSVPYWTYQQTRGKIFINDKALEELRQKYIDNPPGGMTDSDLRDMHYFLTEEDEIDDDEFEEGFYIF